MTQAAEPITKYIATPFAIRPRPGGGQEIRGPWLEEARALSDEQGAILSHCQALATVADHRQVFMSGLPSHQQESGEISAMVVEIINGMAADGLLLEEAEIKRRLSTLPYSRANGKKPWVVIRSCDRPQLLQRLLESLVPQLRQFGQAEKLLLVDDSQPEMAIKNQQNLAAFERKAGLCVQYHGRSQQQAMVRDLVACFPDWESEISWLLNGMRSMQGRHYGRSLNHALLLTAGRRFFLFDDDVIATPTTVNTQSNAWHITGESEDVTFFNDRAELQAALTPLSINIFDRHLACLGQPPRWPDLALDKTHSEDLGHLARGINTKMTSNGVCGDPGVGRPEWLFRLPATTTARMRRDQAFYANVRQRNYVYRGAGSARLCTARGLMTTTMTGLDGSELLPPTIPYYRGEDSVFSLFMDALYPGSVEVQLPWALAHFPGPRPPQTWQRQTLVPSADPVRLLYCHIRDRLGEVNAEAPQGRLNQLGMMLSSFGSFSDAEIGNAMMRQRQQDMSNWAAFLRQQPALLSANHPAWTQDLARAIQAADAAGAERPAPIQNPERATFSNLGAALQVWPALWQRFAEPD